MAQLWKCSFQKDADKADVGRITANYVDDSGAEDVVLFSLSKRINSIVDKTAFVTEAKAALTKFQSDGSVNSTIATSIETELNK